MILDDTIELAIAGEEGERAVAYGTPTCDVLPREVGGLPVLAVLANNDVMPLDTPAIVDARLKPLTLADDEGWQVYRRTLCFLLAKVLHEDFPETRCRVRQSFGHNALFWSWEVPAGERDAKVAALRARLAALIARDVPISHRAVGYAQILDYFRANGQEDKANLLRHRNPPYLGLAVCEGFRDLPQGVLATRSGAIGLFDIVPLRDGFVLEFPGTKTPTELDPMPPYDFLFDVYAEHLRWGEIIGIRDAGELNAAIADGSVELNDVYERRMRVRYVNPACLACKILPICNGGCSQNKMEAAKQTECYRGMSEADKDAYIKTRVEEILKHL